MQLWCIFIHPRIYEISRVHAFLYLAVFPLKYGFIIVQNTIAHFTSSDYQQTTEETHAKCLLKHLQEHFPISDNQWGFNKGQSTIGALFMAVDNITWYRLQEAVNDVCAVLFNHRKVFDGAWSASQTAYG